MWTTGVFQVLTHCHMGQSFPTDELHHFQRGRCCFPPWGWLSWLLGWKHQSAWGLHWTNHEWIPLLWVTMDAVVRCIPIYGWQQALFETIYSLMKHVSSTFSRKSHHLWIMSSHLHILGLRSMWPWGLRWEFFNTILGAMGLWIPHCYGGLHWCGNLRFSFRWGGGSSPVRFPSHLFK